MLTILLEAWIAHRRGLAAYDTADALTSLHLGMVSQVVGLIDLLHQYWVHTEMIGRLGWLDRVFVTPSNHRVHHGQNDYCIDRNYGGILILFGRLFGTYADERDDERIVYGVRTPLRSLNPVWANLHYYADLWRASRSVRGWRSKLYVWLGPPGGWTGEPLGHFDATQFTHYRPATPPRSARNRRARWDWGWRSRCCRNGSVT